MTEPIKLTQSQALLLDDALTMGLSAGYDVGFGRFQTSMSTINSMVKKGVITIKSKSHSPNICKILVVDGVSLHGNYVRFNYLSKT